MRNYRSIMLSLAEKGLYYGENSLDAFVGLLMFYGIFDTQERKLSQEQLDKVRAGEDVKPLIDYVLVNFATVAYQSTTYLWNGAGKEGREKSDIQKNVQDKFKAIFGSTTIDEMQGVLGEWQGIYKWLKLSTQVLLLRDPTKERRDVLDPAVFKELQVDKYSRNMVDTLGLTKDLPDRQSLKKIDHLLFLGASHPLFAERMKISEYVDNIGLEFDRWAFIGGDRDLWISEEYTATYLSLHSHHTEEEVKGYISAVAKEVEGTDVPSRAKQKEAVIAKMQEQNVSWPQEYDMVNHYRGELCQFLESWQARPNTAFKSVGKEGRRANTADNFESYVEGGIAQGWLIPGRSEPYRVGIVSNQPHARYQHAVAEKYLAQFGKKYNIKFEVEVYAQAPRKAAEIGVFADNIARQLWEGEVGVGRAMSQ